MVARPEWLIVPAGPIVTLPETVRAFETVRVEARAPVPIVRDRQNDLELTDG
jgi:hypothetical protein